MATKRCPREECRNTIFEVESLGVGTAVTQFVDVAVVKCSKCGVVVGAVGVEKKN